MNFDKKSVWIILFLCGAEILLPFTPNYGQNNMKVFEKDTYQTALTPVEITFIGHGTLMLRFGEIVLHVDPVMAETDYSALPKADYILVTHHHSDHFDPVAIRKLVKSTTTIICTRACTEISEDLPQLTVLQNGESANPGDFTIEAVPAYNLVHRRADGGLFHPKGVGNGYVLTFANFRIYIAGDTEDIPEMSELSNIDIAFLPMNLPYTMTPQMVANAVTQFYPKIVYPYHYGTTDTKTLVNLLSSNTKSKVLIRAMP